MTSCYSVRWIVHYSLHYWMVVVVICLTEWMCRLSMWLLSTYLIECSCPKMSIVVVVHCCWLTDVVAAFQERLERQQHANEMERGRLVGLVSTLEKQLTDQTRELEEVSRVNGCHRGSLEVNGCHRGSLEVNGCHRGSLEVNGCHRGSLEVSGCHRGSLEVNGCHRGSLEVIGVTGGQWVVSLDVVVEVNIK